MLPICHVQVFPIMSGPQRSMLELFKHLDRRRYDLHVVCQQAGPLTEELDQLGVRWHAVPDLDRPIRPLRDLRAYRTLVKLFRHFRFQLVHTHSSKPGVLGRLAAHRAKVPHVVHHVRGFPFHEHSSAVKWWAYAGVEKWVSPFCERVIFVNHEERQLAIRHGLLPEEKCLTIYNGADLRELSPQRRQPARDRIRSAWGLATDEMAIVFVGRLEYPKQPHLLAEVAAELEALRPRGRWRLLVAGSGPEEGKIAQQIESLGLARRVQLLGWQSDPAAAFHAADVVLLTSLCEGLPRALIEAHAAGVPVVASDARGIREVVTQQTGFLCPIKDPAGYAAALARLLDSPTLRQTMGSAARRRAESHFDSTANNRQIADLYDDLLGQTKSSDRSELAA